MYFSKWDSECYVNSKIEKTLQKKVFYKLTKSIKNELYSKIQFLTLMKAVDGILFIKLKIKQINLKKELFLLDIEQLDEVMIPKELNIN